MLSARRGGGARHVQEQIAPSVRGQRHAAKSSPPSHHIHLKEFTRCLSPLSAPLCRRPCCLLLCAPCWSWRGWALAATAGRVGGRSVALTLTDLGLRHGLCCRDGRFRPHGVADAELSLSASLADVLLLLAGQVDADTFFSAPAGDCRRHRAGHGGEKLAGCARAPGLADPAGGALEPM